MKLAIIGCGLIGKKRALAIEPDDRIVACCDINKSAAEQLAAHYNSEIFDDYNHLLQNADCDAVIIAVVNKYIFGIAVAALRQCKHIITEKPLGRNFSESKKIFDLHQKLTSEQYLAFKTGFNHRFHPGIFEAKSIVDRGIIGELITIRARYGHGGRPGMEKEWRSSKDLCGGGELLDQGVHVIDLIRWFGGEISEVYGNVATKFWNMEVEDNAFAILQTQKGVTASMQVSWTNWRNIFSFEVFGRDGYVKVEGLGGSYGPETLEIGIRKKEGGRPDIEVKEYPPEDISWKKEWEEFKTAIAEKRQPLGDCYDGMTANRIIEAIYRSNHGKRVVKV